jgi:hypothetical protein
MSAGDHGGDHGVEDWELQCGRSQRDTVCGADTLNPAHFLLHILRCGRIAVARVSTTAGGQNP